MRSSSTFTASCHALYLAISLLSSIEYWFRCMDTDGDGVLSMFELEYFYEEQCERMERMGIEPLPFQDLLCQMLDLVKPENQGERQRQLGLRVSTGETKPAFSSEVHTCMCLCVCCSLQGR